MEEKRKLRIIKLLDYPDEKSGQAARSDKNRSK